MVEIDYYELVRQKLALGPLYAPKHKKVNELMKIFWNDEEIKVLSHFESCDKPTSLMQLVKRTGMSREEIKEILSTPLKKKTITKIGSKYTLLPLIPGIFEQYFIHRQDTKENLKKVAEIYRYLFKEWFPSFLVETDFKLFRPRLPLDAKEKLIEIDQSFDVQQKILSYELVEELINKNEFFISVPCQCRLIGELSGEPCKVASPELGCFATGLIAERAIKAGVPGMTKEEAIDFLKKTEKAGLVHSCVPDSSLESSLFICNCCSCHCGFLISAKEHKKVGTTKSNYQPRIDHEICTKCDLCLKKCPMGIIFHRWPNEEDNSDEYMYINEEFCIGCGICAANCPNNAIKLVKVRDNISSEKNKIGNKTFLELLI
ncbi:MAG: 4Fe-4S dicluster domain-containing protein [Promethearchaeota archaeon]